MVSSLNTFEKEESLKCGTFEASAYEERYLAVGSFGGELSLLDIEHNAKALYTCRFHSEIINSIDACGGWTESCGAPEIVTASRDGSVSVW